jgi:peptide/nickel transport system substrate-binding protein
MPTDNKRRKFLKQSVVGGSIVGLAGCTGGQSGGGTDTATATDSSGDGGSGDGGSGDGGGSTPEDDLPGPEQGTSYEPVPELTWLATDRGTFPLRFIEAEKMIEQLERVGFRFEFDVKPFDAWVPAFLDRAWDINVHHSFGNIERIYPFSMLKGFALEYKRGGETMVNLNSWDENEEYIEYFNTFIESLDKEKAQEGAYKCQQLLRLNLPQIALLHPDALVAANTQQYTNWKEMIGTWAYFNLNTLRDVETTGNAKTMTYGNVTGVNKYPNVMAMEEPRSLFLHRFVYETAVQLDYQGQPYPRAAESWEVVDDTTIDITLRDDISWHDGEKLTAEDMAFTLNFVKEYPISYIVSFTDPYVEGAEALDEYTVRANLKTPFSGFVNNTLFMLPILPKHIWDGVVEENDLEHPATWEDPDMTGAGPFKFVDYQPDQRVLLETNRDHYWADEIPFDNLIFKQYGTNSAIVGDMNTGDAHIAQQLGTTEFNRAKQSSNVKAVANRNHEISHVNMNCSMDPLNDVLVRRAMAHAIDRQTLVEVAYGGNAQVATSTIAPANEFWHNPDTKDYEHSVDTAIELLTESGLRWDEDGRLLKPKDWEPHTDYVPLEE